MSGADFLDDVIASRKAVIEKEINVGGKAGKVYFRRLTAGERFKLLRGQKIARTGGATTFELDLGLNEQQRQQYVLYCACREDGSPRFRNSDEVAALDAELVGALYKLAAEVNKEDDEDDGEKAGKS